MYMKREYPIKTTVLEYKRSRDSQFTKEVMSEHKILELRDVRVYLTNAKLKGNVNR